MSNKSQSNAASVLAIGFAGLAVLLLAGLHVLSPEYSPAWRMISEYANGHYAWVLSTLFAAYGLSILSLAYAIRRQVHTRAGKVGLGLLVLSGLGAAAAAVFDLNDVALHELAGAIGIVCLPIAAVLITRSLTQRDPWSGARRPLLWLANLTWVSVVLWIASFVLMVATFIHVLGARPTSVPSEVPAGAIALVGWTNRLLVLSAWAWVAAVAWTGIAPRRQSSSSVAA
jgi:hypothetical membrane protein